MGFNDLTDQVFGELTITSKYERRRGAKRTYTFWSCVCTCGRVDWIRADVIPTRVNCKFCSRSNSHKLEYGRASQNRLFRRYTRDAAKRDLEFKIDFNTFIEITSANCHYCNSKPETIQKEDAGNGDYIYNGIDRVDSSKGYIVGNIVPCCKLCNKFKCDLSRREFLTHIDKIYQHQLEGVQR